MSLLSVEGVSKRYGSRVALDGCSLTVEAGRHLALVGPSGAGKSTLVRAVLGLEKLDAGAVFVDGGPPRPRLVQAVPQDASGSLDPRFTVARTLAEPIRCLRLPDDPRTRAAELVALVGLPPDVLARRPGQLSGGQRQRVALARALAARPRLLLADEVLSALDAATRLDVIDVLRGIGAEVTLLLVSHDLAAARRLADDVAVMDAGRIVEHGPASSVLGHPEAGLTRRLLLASSPVVP